MAYCIDHGTVLEDVPIEKYKEFSEVFAGDLYEEIALTACVERRISSGGCGRASVEAQIKYLKEFLGD